MQKLIKAFGILSPKAKRRFFLLLPIILVGMCLETLSVGMVIPALGILISESYFEEIPELLPYLEYLGNPSHQELIVIGLSGLAGAFILKNIFLFFQVQFQGTFVYSAQREIALELFKKYLNQGYLFHLKTNSSKLIRNLTTEVVSYCGFFLMPVINLITETLVILAILGLILWIEPKGTILLGLILGLLIFLFIKTTNRVVGNWGRKRLEAEEQKIKHLQQGFGGIKEILLSGKIDHFLRRYHRPNQISGLMNKKEYIFQYVPKFGVEIIAILGLVGMCLFLIYQGKAHEEVTHMLGLMATAGFRMIPSFSRILNNLQSIRYGWASVDTLTCEFETSSQHDLKTESQMHLDIPAKLNSKAFNQIVLSNLSFSYSAEECLVLNDINLIINRGDVIGLKGESGSGKSTLINVLLGLLDPTKGEIVIDGQKLVSSMIPSWQKFVGYVPQDIYLLDDNIRRNIAFGLDDSQIDDNRVLEVLKIASLDSLASNSDKGLELLLGERGARLSGGQRQRVGIARALYDNPKIIILDEATSALDENTEKEILSTLEPMMGEKTFIIIAHRETSLKMCSKVFHIRDGSLLAE